MDWRKKHGKPAGFDVLRARKPIIAVGAEHPLDDQKMLADYFRKCQFSGSQLSVLCGRQALTIKDGKDGLGGIHSTVSDPVRTPKFPDKIFDTVSTRISLLARLGSTCSIHQPMAISLNQFQREMTAFSLPLKEGLTKRSCGFCVKTTPALSQLWHWAP